MTREEFSMMARNIHENPDCLPEYREKYIYNYVFDDAAFKQIFVNEKNKRITLDLLNAILDLSGSDCITDLSFASETFPGELDGKGIISDMVADTDRGDRITMEVQSFGDECFRDRLVFYIARHESRNLKKGAPYNLRNFHAISLQLFELYDNEDYRHTIRLKDEKNRVFFEKISITIVEVRKFFRKGYWEDNSRLAQWLRAFRAIETEIIPDDIARDPVFQELLFVSKLSNFSNDNLKTEVEQMYDKEYALACAERKGIREGIQEGIQKGIQKGMQAGMQKGIQEGIQEGIQKGIQEGISQGSLEARREMAKSMLLSGDSVAKIARISGLSEEEIQAL